MVADELGTTRADGRLEIIINRPHARNALSASVLEVLEAVLRQARADAQVRVLVIRGEGEQAFSTGADLKELRDLDSQSALKLMSIGQRVLRMIETLRKPVVAAVDGYAVGGGLELCLACSFVLSSDRSRFGLPEAGLGLIPGFGGTQRLSRMVGKQRALRVMLVGEILDADTAYDLGLLAFRPVPSDELPKQVDGVCDQLATKSPHAMSSILQSVDTAANVGLEAGLELETCLAWIARESPDGVEGVHSFFAKREPRFRGLSLDALAPTDG